jgi:cytochrome b6-f complex iron-sulfur subunit
LHHQVPFNWPAAIFTAVERRDFIRSYGALVGGCALAVLFPGCATTAVAVSATREDGFLVFPESELRDKDFVSVSHPELEFPVYVRGGKSPATTGVLLSCTHQGCELEPRAKALVCPCHGSTFSTSGAVTRLPATEPLTTFPITFSNGQVRIKVW